MKYLDDMNYELVEGYDFEMYYSDFGKFHEEIWIRVIPKD